MPSVKEPKTPEEVKKDTKMMKYFIAYMKRMWALNELTFYFDKGNARSLYEKYIGTNSKDEVNLPSALRKRADKMKKDGVDWNNAEWKKVVADAKKHCRVELLRRVASFKTTPEWDKYVALQTPPAKKAPAPPR